MFRFKQFAVDDDKSTMKVGTDAVLLGSWVDVGGAKTILDVGSGCGVIALMMAQRAPMAKVDAIEIDRDSAVQASENFKASPWNVHAHNTAIQEFDHAPYDLIVSNPPFFSGSLLPPKAKRKNARHTETLSFDELLISIKRLLDDGGRFAVVLPMAEGNVAREKAAEFGFHCNRSLAFYTRNGKPQERWLLEFSRKFSQESQETLTLYQNGDTRSVAYSELTRDFYL